MPLSPDAALGTRPPDRLERPARNGPAPALAGRRILIVLESLDLGGAERQASMLATDLAARQGARVEVWGLGPEGRASALLREAGIACRSVPVRLPRGRLRVLGLALSFARRLRAARADAIVPYTLVPNVLCCAGAPVSGAKACLWNQRDAGIGRLGSRLERFAVRRATALVANSRSAAAYLTGTMGVDPARVRIVPNGVAPRAPLAEPPSWRGRLGLAPDAFLVVMIANLHANKDHATLLRAFRSALDRWPLADRPATLLLAGSRGETHAALTELARTLALGERVRFLGPVDDVPGLLAACDLVAHSSAHEGCPNAVLEAMASGLAVVGTDAEGIRDAVGPVGEALLAPPGDAPALAARLIEAAGDPALRARSAEEGRRRAEREFSPRVMGDAMASLIEECLA